MEKINETLKRLASNQSFQKRYAEIRNQVLNHPDIKEFLAENREILNQETIEKSITKLFEYMNQSKECNKCVSLDQCINMMQGYHPRLVINRNLIDVEYERCPRKIMADEKRKNERLIKSLHGSQ